MSVGIPGWKGYWAASPTPFNAGGGIENEWLEQTIGYFLAEGVHGLLINGSSGEWFSQSPAERRAVAEAAVRAAGQAVPVVIGCTALQAREVTELAEHAHRAGADGIMVSPPPYLRLSQDDIVAFFEFVTGATPLPVMVYNIPRRSGTVIDAATALRLADLNGVAALKNSAPDAEFFPALELVAEKILVFGANLFSPRGVSEIAAGRGSGYIGGWELLGRKLPRVFEAAWRGDLETAQRLAAQERALDLRLWDERKNPKFGRSFNAQLKAALRLLGVPAGVPRRPLLPLDDESAVRALADVLAGAGIPLATSSRELA
ncbi:MAG TPA: dihydrodipicolinate synthase family protein [Streptosporangiaceae bacterium]|jgi:4-hydroxy-tetrahydrodipicolinate synthase